MADQWTVASETPAKPTEWKVETERPAAPPNPFAGTSEGLKDEGFLGSIESGIASIPSYFRDVFTGKRKARNESESAYMNWVAKYGSDEEKKKAGLESTLSNIPFASTAYKATHGNLGGAAGDVVGLAPYALLDSGVRGGAAKLGKAAVAELPGAKYVGRVMNRAFPAPEEPPPAFKFDVNPKTASLLRRGGGAAPSEAGPPSSSVRPSVRPSERAAGFAKPGETQPAAPAEPKPLAQSTKQLGKRAAQQQPESGRAVSDNSVTARDARTIARKLKDVGMSVDQAKTLSAEDLESLTKRLGIRKPNAAMLQQILFELKRLGS